MKPRLSIFILFLLASAHSSAQSFELMFSGGFGTYAMKDLRDLSKSVQHNLPFESSVVSDFPLTPEFGGHAGILIAHIYTVGVMYSFNSTGGRVASSDYSGSYRFDNVISGHSIGLINHFTVFEKRSFGLELQVDFGALFSRLKISERLQVADTLIASEGKLKSAGVFIQPGLEVTYRWKMMKAGISGGYLVNPASKISDMSGNKSGLTVCWTGFRFGISIGLLLGPRKKHEK